MRQTCPAPCARQLGLRASRRRLPALDICRLLIACGWLWGAGRSDLGKVTVSRSHSWEKLRWMAVGGAGMRRLVVACGVTSEYRSVQSDATLCLLSGGTCVPCVPASIHPRDRRGGLLVGDRVVPSAAAGLFVWWRVSLHPGCGDPPRNSAGDIGTSLLRLLELRVADTG